MNRFYLFNKTPCLVFTFINQLLFLKNHWIESLYPLDNIFFSFLFFLSLVVCLVVLFFFLFFVSIFCLLGFLIYTKQKQKKRRRKKKRGRGKKDCNNIFSLTFLPLLPCSIYSIIIENTAK